MASLNLFDGQRTLQYPIPEGETVVGRLAGSGVQMLWNTVSGTHAKFIKMGGNCILEDLNSRNGTFVNGQRVAGRVLINHGDQVAFGQVVCQYLGDGAPPMQPVAYAPQQAMPGAPQPMAYQQPMPPQQPFPSAPFPAAPFPVQPMQQMPVQQPFAPQMQRPGMMPPPMPGGQRPAAPFSVPPTAPQPANADPGKTVAVASGTLTLDEDDTSSATITGAVNHAGRFGMLAVNPGDKLKAVLEISQSLAGTHDLNALLPKILDTLFKIFPHADRGCIVLKDSATGQMQSRAFKHRRAGEDATVRLSKTIMNKVLKEKAAILSADAATDELLSSSASIAELKIRSMMCVPFLGLDGEPVGLISIDSQNPLGQFKNEDLEILTAVAGQAALSFEGARLLETYMLKKKLDSEMEIARDVQRGLLPTEFPKVDGYEFFASYDSAQAVGGDYYDVIRIDQDRIALSFGDVAGKGVPGALIMGRMNAAVQATLKLRHEVQDAICAINDLMCHQSSESRFVTYILAILNVKTHELTIANAGHMPPIIRKADGSIDHFNEDLAGPPICVVDDYPYDVETRIIEPGEMVVIITDGVDEAMNADKEQYTKERVVEFVAKGSPKADELGKALLADVRRHAQGVPQSDDITIMTFGRNPL